MEYLSIVEWIAHEVVDTTDEMDQVEANVDYFMETLTQDIQLKAERLADQKWRIKNGFSPKETQIMTYKVFMTAFGEGEVREVDLPSEGEQSLERIFYYGQNEFQPREFPSVSVGDVIEFGGELFLVMPFGFKKMSRGGFELYLQTPRRERVMYAFGDHF